MSDSRGYKAQESLLDVADQEASVYAFLADAIADIDWLLEAKGVSRKALAEGIGVSEQRISNIFAAHGATNLTLKSVARILVFLGEDARLSSPTLERLRHLAALSAFQNTPDDSVRNSMNPWEEKRSDCEPRPRIEEDGGADAGAFDSIRAA